MPRSLPRTRAGTEFVDTLVGSPSFTVFSDKIRADFAAAAADREAGTLVRPDRAGPGAALVLFLAHHLGRATIESPALLRDRPRALLVGWEVEELTTTLAEELSGGDVLLGISRFSTAAFQRHFPEVPAITVPLCPPVRPRPAANRARWGIPDGVTAFLNIFNPVSGFDRKNPIDAYDAFLRAFPDRQDVRLVFKVHGGFAKQPDEGDLAGEEHRAGAFLARCASDDRVILIDEFLDADGVATLVASCDAYVSLARAEGLGLPVLEAMALGVPTVCLAYSGHTDFVTGAGSLLVPYDIIDVPADASHYYNPRFYDRPPRWAQPRIEEAATMMRRLADDPGLRERLGRGAVDAAAAYRRRCEESAWLSDLERALTSPAVADRHPAKEREFQRVARRDRDEWLDHEQRVRRARRELAIRSELGRVKRAALRVLPGRRSD